MSFEWKNLLAPLSNTLWSTTLLTVLLIGGVMASVQFLCIRAGVVKEDRPSIIEAFFVVFGLFCQQGGDVKAGGCISTRTVTLVACVTSLVFIAAYSAALISVLANQRLVLPFNSLQGLADDGTYNLGISSESVYDLFRNATDPLYKQLFKRFFHHEGDMLPIFGWEVIARLCEGNFAYIATKENEPILVPLLNGSCSITWLPETIMKDTLAMISVKNNPYRGLMNYNLRLLRDSGALRRLELLTWPDDESTTPNNVFTEIGFSQVVPILTVTALGMGLAVVVLAIEAAISGLGA